MLARGIYVASTPLSSYLEYVVWLATSNASCIAIYVATVVHSSLARVCSMASFSSNPPRIIFKYEQIQIGRASHLTISNPSSKRTSFVSQRNTHF
jgi:hypothetical protein